MEEEAECELQRAEADGSCECLKRNSRRLHGLMFASVEGGGSCLHDKHVK